MKLLLNDSSVLVNLLAADCLAEIAADLDWQLAICVAVRDEVTKLRDPATGDTAPVDITPLIASGLLQVLELAGEREQMLYVGQVIAVDDGEAMSIAIAASRGLELAIDDKQASNHVRRAFPEMKLWTTPGILKYWTEAASISAERLREIIGLIQARARYFPARSHPLFAWWHGDHNV
jgi:predicted nucleic acid-binding protein